MPTYVALLRAVNLGPHARVSMARLRELITAQGWGHARTHLASGNAVFTSELTEPAPVARRLRDALAANGLDTEVMVRTGHHFVQLAEAGHPLAVPGAAHTTLQVAFPLTPVTTDQVQAMPIPGEESAVAGAGEVFLHYPHGVGRSKLTTAHLQRHLGTPVTCRNWKTVTTLAGWC
ncbi:DUF1697 domain-containing protein [Saccharopolyspora rhizosphaerae]|uniref:DUF1697 domain-containing protein n=1 Tax=Saccharopolyspora rhizosphaerae TaxID=2492662 RepID=A0A426K533_9PSEU|nr:DUF1697 domain-containing protein [Saccharopolyspora rhizosphaerae]RRO20510.1 DUF1697 domain-containing protein [Saccharopolyspora rhizosphaerae]